MEKIPEKVFKKIKKFEIVAKENVLDKFSGMYRSAFKGKGIELNDIREFQPDDDIRDISWSKTAQMGRPFVKTFHEERDLTVIIMVDISSSLNFRSHYESKRERIAEISALIAFSGVYNHDKIGLILFSNEIEKYIPPKRGEQHTVRLIIDLLVYEPTNKVTDIAKALRFLNTVFHKRSIIFLLSDFISPPYSKEFLITAKKNDLIPIRILDPEEESLNIPGLTHMVDLETKKVMLVDINKKVQEEYKENYDNAKKMLLELSTKMNIGTIDITTYGPYKHLIQAYFNMRKRHKH